MRRLRSVSLLTAAAGVVAATSACAAGPAASWDEPAHYTYEATITVFGPAHGEWRVTVRDHEVVEVEGLDEWSEIDEFTTIESFDTLADYVSRYDEARAEGAHSVTLTQAKDGTPTRYSVDWDENTVDDEYDARFRAVTPTESTAGAVTD